MPTTEEKLDSISKWLSLADLVIEMGFVPLIKKLAELVKDKTEDPTIEELKAMRDKLPIDEPFFDEKEGD